MTPTKARAQVLDFPAIYYYPPAAFAVHADNTSVQKVEDLDGKVVGACAACTYEDYLRRKLVLDVEGVPPFSFLIRPQEIKTYDNDGLALDDLRIGDGVRLDGILTNLPTLEEAKKNGYPLRILEPAVLYEPLAVAVDKGDPEFSAQIAQIVESMKQDGTLKALSEKWFGLDLTTLR